jgi:cytochrome c oxidase subunit 3
MSPDETVLTPEERAVLDESFVVRHRLEEQFRDLDQQHETAALGMWVFLATEVMFFGTLFLGVAVYRYLYQHEVVRCSAKLNWKVGGVNTVVLLVSSVFMVLAVHYARIGRQRPLEWCLAITAGLGVLFLGLKGYEYYTDFRDNLVPGTRYFDDEEWLKDEPHPPGVPLEPEEKALRPDQVPHVKLFLLFYWIMTALHGLHVTIGIAAVLTLLVLARRGHFSPAYYSPVDVTALYWHFVDIVWIFLLPMLYLLGSHTI